MERAITILKRYFRDLHETGRVIFNASQRFFFGLIVIVLVVGVGLPYALIVLGDMIDALVGARGVGVVTSDLTTSSVTLLVMVLLLVGGFLLLSALRGTARTWAWRATELVGIVVLLLVATPASLIRLPLQVVGTVVLRHYPKKSWRWAAMILIALAFILHAPVVLEAAVLGEIRTGQFVMFMAADILLSLWSLFVLSPYARHN